MAASAFSRARLLNELSRPRSSSPRDEEYATATALSFDPARDAIHSTARFDELTNTQQQLPQARQSFGYSQNMDRELDAGSEDSASMMSIEMGRGVKRGMRDQDGDVSSNVVFNMGNDSLYEVTTTPPIRAKTPQRKVTDGLRRQASAKRAADTSKPRETGEKYRSLSNALNGVSSSKTSAPLPKQRQTSVPSRFASNNAYQPDRFNNPPTASNQSFLLPEGLPDLTELVSGTRKDGTPVFNRNAKSRSRFTSGSYKPARQEHYPIEGVPLPDEEKAIYTSLQLLKERVEQLEMDKSEAQKRAEEYEDQIVDLQSQLAVAQRRPDSALGSDEESAGNERLRRDKSRLQASAKSLQTHLDRSERKLSVAEIAVKRMREERDKLVEQIGKAYFDFEEVKAENDTFKETFAGLQQENEDLKEEVQVLRDEIRVLQLANPQKQSGVQDQQRERKANRMQGGAIKAAQDLSKAGGNVRSKEEANPAHGEDVQSRRRSTGQLNDDLVDDIASRVLKEVQKNRERASKPNSAIKEPAAPAEPKAWIQSRSQPRQESRDTGSGASRTQSRRITSVPAEEEDTDVESTTHLDFDRKVKNPTAKSSSGRKGKTATEDDDRDYTVLSLLDAMEVGRLRKKLEEEHRAGRLSNAPAASEQTKGTTQPTPGLGRKSSLKDVTVALGENSRRFSIQGGDLDPSLRPTKNVRVQSPQSTDPTEHAHGQTDGGDASLLSNISRRRRRAVSADGDPSVFILPDITFNNNHRANFEHAAIPHDTKTCTACPQNNSNSAPKLPIPDPTPVTTRADYDPDVTSATIRPSEPPAVALATVLKQLEDEIKHLKEKLAVFNAIYTRHDPAMHKSRRVDVQRTIANLTAEVERRSNQVYALYDVLEGQKRDDASGAAAARRGNDEITDDEVNDTLQSIGMDAAEISGRVGRGGAHGLDGALDQISEQSEELPWEGLSDFDDQEQGSQMDG